MSTQTSDTVSYEIVENIGLIALNHQPVNAASHDLRAGIVAAIDALTADETVQAIAIYGATRAFIAGADISEFGKPIAEPILPDVCLAIENSAKPVVAVMHGATLGGGLEVAISAHARVALPNLITGFPEVTLGVLPGSGGTQRGPRLIGIAATLDLATTGRRIGAEEAMKIGLVDRISKGEPRDLAVSSARDMLTGGLPIRKTSALPVVPDPEALKTTAATLAKTQPHLFSPRKCAEAIAASTGPFAEGMEQERKLFFECIDSPQRAGLIHAFFSERAVAKIPEAGATPRDIASVGIIGGGTMGSGIATAALLAGFSVTLVELDQDGLDRGRATIEKNLGGAVKRGKLTDDKRAALLADAFVTTTDLTDLAEADLVIEAVFEDMAVKQDIFRQLDAICKPGAVLATNTSYLDVNQIAAVTQRPGDIIGLHFFSPAHVMRLLEVVVADKTRPEVVATGFALGKKLRKVTVRAGVCDGFIGNRILSHFRKVADYLVMDGASPAQVDRAMTDFGFAMGPFAVLDLAGLDIGWATRKRKAPNRVAAERYVEIADRICESGWFGRKTGQGYYVYGDGAPMPNPEVETIIAQERTKAGISTRDFSDAEIVDRYMTAMISEATRVLADGIALRPIDIDAVFLFGYGFPRHHGGPLQYADTIGAPALIERIESYAPEDAYYWQVPPLLQEMAATGNSFADMNREA